MIFFTEVNTNRWQRYVSFFKPSFCVHNFQAPGKLKVNIFLTNWKYLIRKFSLTFRNSTKSSENLFYLLRMLQDSRFFKILTTWSLDLTVRFHIWTSNVYYCVLLKRKRDGMVWQQTNIICKCASDNTKNSGYLVFTNGSMYRCFSRAYLIRITNPLERLFLRWCYETSIFKGI